MPSYIELDKNASLPAASSAGKIVLGVNTSGALQLTNNNGTAIPVSGGDISSLSLTVNTDSIGPKVSFTKTNYGTETDVIIAGELEIARGNNGGIFNKAVEQSYNQNTGTPAGTAWNSKYIANNNGGEYGDSNLAGVPNRDYSPWVNAVNDGPPYAYFVDDLYFVMVFESQTLGAKYYLIKFTQWTQGNAGGGFAYDRWELFPKTTFTKANGGTDTDAISAGVVLARDSASNGMYNSVLESGPDQNAGLSPLNTEWNSQNTDSLYYGDFDLSNVRRRKYDIYANAIGGNMPDLDTSYIMHDKTTDLYWNVVFSTFGDYAGGKGEPSDAVTYTRTLIPIDNGITYPNGTFQTSANTQNVYNIDLGSVNGYYTITSAGTYMFANTDGYSVEIPKPAQFIGQTITLINIDGSSAFSLAGTPIYIAGESNIRNSLDKGGCITILSVGDTWRIINQMVG